MPALPKRSRGTTTPASTVAFSSQMQSAATLGRGLRFGKPHQFGLEAGSKPELMIALAMLDTPGALLICNGYKDREYIETAMLATRLGADADYCDRAD